MRPDGTSVSDVSDILRIQNIYVDSNYGNNYYIFQTATWFPRSILTIGDRLIVGGLNISNVPSTQYAAAFTNYITQDQGHIITDVGYAVNNIFSNALNTQGYGNAFAISAYNSNVVGGNVPPSYFTNASEDTAFFNAMRSNTLTGCKAINMNHQTATYLKITTKHYDNTSLIRSENI
jgi:hypothetical protein